MGSAFGPGIETGLALVLLLAGSLKLGQQRAFESSLVSLLPRGLWRYGINSYWLSLAVIGVEFLTGALLLSPLRGDTALMSWVAALFLCFLVLSLRARHANEGCSCFGAASSSSGGMGAMARSLFLVCCAVWASFAPDASETPFHGTAIASALVVLVIGAWPVFQRTFSASFTGRSKDGDAHGAVELKDALGATTRRRFLGQLGGFAAVIVASVFFGAQSALAGGESMSCEGAFDLCYGCVTKGQGTVDVSCCISCYGSCQMLVPCPSGSCAGCWP